MTTPATHMYDYQSVITDPDRYDKKLLEWKKITAGKPFLSPELCANANPYQSPCYRLALSMGQLYHKNLVLADAAAICYCWTLLNVAEPSYGWTRTLCVPDPSQGFIPVASSHQLRVFGAFSRRIREGMTRLHAASSNGDLLTSAFSDDAGRQTIVMLNRATRQAVVRINWPGANLPRHGNRRPLLAQHRVTCSDARRRWPRTAYSSSGRGRHVDQCSRGLACPTGSHWRTNSLVQ